MGDSQRGVFKAAKAAQFWWELQRAGECKLKMLHLIKIPFEVSFFPCAEYEPQIV